MLSGVCRRVSHGSCNAVNTLQNAAALRRGAENRVFQPLPHVGTAIARYIPYRREGGKSQLRPRAERRDTDVSATGWRRPWVAQGYVGTAFAAGHRIPRSPTHQVGHRRKVFRRKAVMRAVTRQPLWPGHQWKPPTRPLRVGGLPFFHIHCANLPHGRPASVGMGGGCLQSNDWVGAQPVMQERASATHPARGGQQSSLQRHAAESRRTSAQRSSSSASWCFLHRR